MFMFMMMTISKKISQKLGVDENKNKEVESDDIVLAKKEEEITK